MQLICVTLLGEEGDIPMKKEFSSKVYGYDKKEVDRYIEELKKDYEEELARKRDRMLELAEETRKLKLELQEQGERLERLSEQEKYVSRALIKAEQRAQTIIEDGRKRSAKEMEQMVAEKEKWQNKFRQVRQELLTFEKNLLQIIEKFRDDINYYSAQEVSDSILVSDSSSIDDELDKNTEALLEGDEVTSEQEVLKQGKRIKEKVIA
jgi:cell division initiation protein